MYLSKLMLNPRNRQALREVAFPYEMHRTLLSAFPTGKVHVERTDADAVAMLFRVDTDRAGIATVLVQSRAEPDWSVLNDCYLLEPPQTKSFRLSIEAGRVLSFRLRANPTKRLSAGKGNNGKRVGLYSDEEQAEWLARKAELGGFQTAGVTIGGATKLSHGRARLGQRRAYDPKLFVIQFDGILQVTDAERFAGSLAAGIGPAKAFGCGLLSVASPR